MDQRYALWTAPDGTVSIELFNNAGEESSRIETILSPSGTVAHKYGNLISPKIAHDYRNYDLEDIVHSTPRSDPFRVQNAPAVVSPKIVHDYRNYDLEDVVYSSPGQHPPRVENIQTQIEQGYVPCRTLFVRIVSGDTIVPLSLDVSPFHDIADIKLMISNQLFISADHQALSYGGQQLIDGMNLQTLGIGDRETIEAVVWHQEGAKDGHEIHHAVLPAVGSDDNAHDDSIHSPMQLGGHFEAELGRPVRGSKPTFAPKALWDATQSSFGPPPAIEHSTRWHVPSPAPAQRPSSFTPALERAYEALRRAGRDVTVGSPRNEFNAAPVTDHGSEMDSSLSTRRNAPKLSPISPRHRRSEHQHTKQDIQSHGISKTHVKRSPYSWDKKPPSNDKYSKPSTRHSPGSPVFRAHNASAMHDRSGLGAHGTPTREFPRYSGEKTTDFSRFPEHTSRSSQYFTSSPHISQNSTPILGYTYSSNTPLQPNLPFGNPKYPPRKFPFGQADYSPTYGSRTSTPTALLADRWSHSPAPPNQPSEYRNTYPQLKEQGNIRPSQQLTNTYSPYFAPQPHISQSSAPPLASQILPPNLLNTRTVQQIIALQGSVMSASEWWQVRRAVEGDRNAQQNLGVLAMKLNFPA